MASENHGWGRYKPRTYRSDTRAQVQKPVQRTDAKVNSSEALEILKSHFRRVQS